MALRNITNICSPKNKVVDNGVRVIQKQFKPTTPLRERIIISGSPVTKKSLKISKGLKGEIHSFTIQTRSRSHDVSSSSDVSSLGNSSVALGRGRRRPFRGRTKCENLDLSRDSSSSACSNNSSIFKTPQLPRKPFTKKRRLDESLTNISLALSDNGLNDIINNDGVRVIQKQLKPTTPFRKKKLNSGSPVKKNSPEKIAKRPNEEVHSLTIQTRSRTHDASSPSSVSSSGNLSVAHGRGRRRRPFKGRTKCDIVDLSRESSSSEYSNNSSIFKTPQMPTKPFTKKRRLHEPLKDISLAVSDNGLDQSSTYSSCSSILDRPTLFKKKQKNCDVTFPTLSMDESSINGDNQSVTDPSSIMDKKIFKKIALTDNVKFALQENLADVSAALSVASELRDATENSSADFTEASLTFHLNMSKAEDTRMESDSLCSNQTDIDSSPIVRKRPFSHQGADSEMLEEMSSEKSSVELANITVNSVRKPPFSNMSIREDLPNISYACSADLNTESNTSLSGTPRLKRLSNDIVSDCASIENDGPEPAISDLHVTRNSCNKVTPQRSVTDISASHNSEHLRSNTSSRGTPAKPRNMEKSLRRILLEKGPFKNLQTDFIFPNISLEESTASSKSSNDSKDHSTDDSSTAESSISETSKESTKDEETAETSKESTENEESAEEANSEDEDESEPEEQSEIINTSTVAPDEIIVDRHDSLRKSINVTTIVEEILTNSLGNHCSLDDVTPDVLSVDEMPCSWDQSALSVEHSFVNETVVPALPLRSIGPKHVPFRLPEIQKIYEEAIRRADEKCKRLRMQCSPPKESPQRRKQPVGGPKRLAKPRIKKYKPDRWANKRLYNYLEKVLEPTHKHNRVTKAEEIVKHLHITFQKIKNSKNHEHTAIEKLKVHLAREKVILTTEDFYKFIDSYMPIHFCDKVIPCLQPFTGVIWPPVLGFKKPNEPILD